MRAFSINQARRVEIGVAWQQVRKGKIQTEKKENGEKVKLIVLDSICYTVAAAADSLC